MDPYDEILEQLRHAREKGLQTVKDRFEGILGSLEAASAGVRDAMLLEADDLAPLGEIPAAMEGLQEAAREAASVPPPIVTLDLLRELDASSTQSDLLHGLLSALTGHAARAVVLVFRPDAIGAWSAIGFEDASRLEKWSCDREESPLFDRFVDDPAPQQFEPGEDPVVRRWLEGESTPTEALLVPISLRGKTMGAVYVDRLEDRPWNPEAVQVLVALSCWMIDTLKYRAASGSPVLAPVGGVAPQPEPEVEAGDWETEELEAPEDSMELGDEEAPGSEDEQEAEEMSPPEDAAEIESAETEEEPAPEEPTAAEAALDEMAAGPGFDPSATVQVDPDDTAHEVEVKVVADDDEPEPATVADEDLEAEYNQSAEAVEVETPAVESELQVPPRVEAVVPPPDLDEEPAEVTQTDLSPAEESRHEEARRFARLLVSEIKLYNEEAVERGREQRDLYARLKEDIDRSREMFERRIPPEIRTTRDYFHEELVRILGDGKSDALGM